MVGDFLESNGRGGRLAIRIKTDQNVVTGPVSTRASLRDARHARSVLVRILSGGSASPFENDLFDEDALFGICVQHEILKKFLPMLDAAGVHCRRQERLQLFDRVVRQQVRGGRKHGEERRRGAGRVRHEGHGCQKLRVSELHSVYTTNQVYVLVQVVYISTVVQHQTC